MIRKTLAVGITLLFIVSVISPLVFGNNVELKQQKQISILEEPPDVEWIKTFGGEGDDKAESVQQTSDGGYIICGQTRSFSYDGYEDAWLIKTNENGEMEWEQNYGEPGMLKIDGGNDAVETADGGYVFTGSSRSYNDEEEMEIWLVKTDEDGEEEWNHIYMHGRGYSMCQTIDSGYIIYGDSHFTPILLKIDSDGYEQWNKTFFEKGYSTGDAVIQTADGSYVVTGRIVSDDEAHCYLLKTDSNGEMEWIREYTEPTVNTAGKSVRSTSDGGFIITGYGANDDNGGFALLIKTDEFGNEQWSNIYRDSLYVSCRGYDGEQTQDGGYIICGQARLDNWQNNLAAFLIKVDADGNKEWELIPVETTIFDEYWFHSVQQTADGGFIATGIFKHIGDYDVLLVKVKPESDIRITRPEDALYIFNNKIRDYFFRKPLIIGAIDVEAVVYDENITMVEFYVDDQLMETDTSEPYSWRWSSLGFFQHTIKVAAYNGNKSISVDEKSVWKFF